MFDPISKIAKTPKQRIIIWVFIVLTLIILLLSGKILRQFRNPEALKVWGLNLTKDQFDSLTKSFRYKGLNVTMEYTEKNPDTYEQDLNKALINGESPDVFMINNSWVGKYEDIITPLNLTKDEDYNLKKIKDEYPAVIETDLIIDNYLLGIPLSIDTLALYYNRSILDQSGISSSPQTWDELVNMLSRLRIVDQYKRIQRSVIPMGLVDNVNHAGDILGLLFLQKGAKIVNADHKELDFDNPTIMGSSLVSAGEQALNFYTQFAKPGTSSYNWNSSLPNSLDAFAFGQSVFYIGYAKDKIKIQNKNPNLNFGVGPMPQFDQNAKSNFASYDTFVVYGKTRDIDLAWGLLKYFMQDKTHNEYMEKSNLPPAKRIGVNLCSGDPELSVFCQNILTAKSYYRSDYTEFNQAFENMINEVMVRGVSERTAIQNAKETLQSLLYQKN